MTANTVDKAREALIASLPAQPTELVLMQVQRAAELSVICQRMRARALAGRGVDLNKVLKAENLLGRLLRQLGLDRPPKERVRMPWELVAERKTAEG